MKMTDENYFEDEMDLKLEFAKFLEKQKYAKALTFAQTHNLTIKPNKYIKNQEDLAEKAASELKRKGEYEEAYNILINYAPNAKNIKEHAKDCAHEVLLNLIQAYEYANDPQETH